jgi:hypothetical protein
VRAGYDPFISSLRRDHPAELRLAALVEIAALAISLGIALTVSLYVSFNLTLWLLSLVASSNRRMILIFVLDFFAAILLPQILTTLMMIALSIVVLYLNGGVAEYQYYHVPASLANLILGTFLSGMQANLGPTLLPVWLMYSLGRSGPASVWMPYLFVSVFDVIVDYIETFFLDVYKFINLDFSPPLFESIRNWAIFTDLAFSLVYLLPCLAIVFAGRNPVSRGILLNLVQWVGDHPKGPLYALREACLSLVQYLLTILKKKDS